MYRKKALRKIIISNWVIIAALGGLLLLWAFLLDDTITVHNAFNGPAGNILSEFLGGVVFLLVGIHLQRTTEKKIDDLYEDLRMDQDKEEYNRMITFLKSGDTYNFFTPDHSKNNGSPFVYTLKGVLDEKGNAIAMENEMVTERVIYVEDIAYRSVLEEDDHNEYIYGPLKVGEAYYTRYSGLGWYLQTTWGKQVRIEWAGKSGGAYFIPTPNSLVKKIISYDLGDIKPFSEFIYTPEGEESNSGTLCQLYEKDGEVFIVLSRDGILRRVIATTAENDFTSEEYFIKIERAEGFFSSKAALDAFKNLINEKCQENGKTIKELPFYEATEFQGI
jgi:hypothetical protein